MFDEILFTASFTCSNFETSTTLESKFLLSISLTAFDNSASSISQIKTFAPEVKKVLAISNKEQRGYLTPDEFNKTATQVQLEIFEKYFEDLNQQLRVPQADVD